MSKTPPRPASWMLKHLMPGSLTHSAMSDYEELYARLLAKRGGRHARLWYWGQAFKAVPLAFFWGGVMFTNYAKLTWRNMRRQTMFSLINISGLAIGIACAVLVLLWVKDELSFDRFHTDARDIYWIGREIRQPDRLAYSYATSARLAEALKQEFPEVLAAAAYNGRPRSLFRRGDQAFTESSLKITENAFFEIFSFPFIKGDPQTALSDTSSIVITESIAEKYFGREDPIGKTLNWNDWVDYRVSGVIKDPPPNTHLQFGIMKSHQTMKQSWPAGLEWENKIFRTYIKLRKDVDAVRFSRELTSVINRKYPHRSELEDRYLLMPVTRVRHHDLGGGGQIKYIYMFCLIALFILCIACVNFMNLSTARSAQRAREVGQRKVVGARRAQLVRQFFGESIILVFLAFALALILDYSLMSAFNGIAGKQLSIPLFEPWFLLASAGLILFTGILAGSYPALFLSSFSPVTVIRGIRRQGSRGALFRRTLVVFQFTLSIGLIIGTMVVHRQLDFMRNRELGFDKDNVVYVPMKAAVGRQYRSIKTALLDHPEIVSVTAKDRLPLRLFDTVYVEWEAMPEGAKLKMERPWVGYDYFRTMGMRIVAGRDFSREYPTDVETAYIANQEAVRLMGLESPTGSRIRVGGQDGTLIGVVGNAHFRSRQFPIYPELYRLLPRMDTGELDLFGVVLIRIQTGKIQEGLSVIENMWNDVNRNYPFEYHFLDEAIDGIYHRELKINTLVDAFSLLAVFISCLGLFGLASFMAEIRTKEIGVRKVLGASTLGIMGMISKEYAVWVGAANLIAWPLIGWIMSNWLRGYAFRIELSPWIFLGAGLGALLIALLTVSHQAFKAAHADPADALRYE